MVQILRYKLESKNIIIVDGLLSDSYLNKVNFVVSNWPLSRSGVTEYDSRSTLHLLAHGNQEEIKRMPFYDSLVDHVQTDFGVQDPVLSRLFYREFVYGDHLEYHVDSQEGEVTGILYLNKEWDKNNHGELLFLDKDLVGLNILPRAGRLVLFDSRLLHRSSCPSRICYDSRKILVFNFATALKKDFCDAGP